MYDILRETRAYQEMTKESREEGREEGRQEGLEEGRQEGKLEALRQTLLTIAQERFHNAKMTRLTLMGRKREAISRLLSSDDVNPTLNTFIELLSALKLTADITLRQAREGEGPIRVVMELTPPQ